MTGDESSAPISVRFDPRLQAHVLRFSGEVTVSEAQNALKAVYQGHCPPRPLNLLFVDAGLQRYFNRSELVTLMEFARRNRPDCPGLTALVGPTDLSYGILRMAEGVGGEFSGHLRVFRSTAEAEAWIAAGNTATGVA